MNEEINDNYYVCVNCGILIMAEDLIRDDQDVCPNCGSGDLDFFEG